MFNFNKIRSDFMYKYPFIYDIGGKLYYVGWRIFYECNEEEKARYLAYCKAVEEYKNDENNRIIKRKLIECIKCIFNKADSKCLKDNASTYFYNVYSSLPVADKEKVVNDLYKQWENFILCADLIYQNDIDSFAETHRE